MGRLNRLDPSTLKSCTRDRELVLGDGDCIALNIFSTSSPASPSSPYRFSFFFSLIPTLTI